MYIATKFVTKMESIINQPGWFDIIIWHNIDMEKFEIKNLVGVLSPKENDFQYISTATKLGRNTSVIFEHYWTNYKVDVQKLASIINENVESLMKSTSNAFRVRFWVSPHPPYCVVKRIRSAMRHLQGVEITSMNQQCTEKIQYCFVGCADEAEPTLITVQTDQFRRISVFEIQVAFQSGLTINGALFDGQFLKSVNKLITNKWNVFVEGDDCRYRY